MDEPGRRPPVKLMVKSRIVVHPQHSRPAQPPVALAAPASVPVPAPAPAASTVAGLEELVLSGHILGMSTSVQNDRFCFAACIENNPELQFIGEGGNAEEALADLKAKVLELGMVI